MSRKLTVRLKITATGVQNYSNNRSSSSTFLLDPSSSVDSYILSSGGKAVALTSNISITNDPGVDALTGDFIEIKYCSNVILSGFRLTFFGQDLPTHLTTIDTLIHAFYDGISWNVLFIPSVVTGIESVNNNNIVADSITASELAANCIDTSELVNNAVTTVKISDGNVTAAKLASDSVTSAKILDGEVLVEKLENQAKESNFAVPIHFDYSAKDSYYIALPVKCTLIRVTSTVSGVAIDATGLASMTVYNETQSASIMSSATLHSAGTAENNMTSVSIATNGDIAQNDIIRFTPDGAAATGKLFIVLTLRRRAD